MDLDYETSGRTVKPGAELSPVLPRIGMPSCLSFCWELARPPCWQARSYGPSLLPSDPGSCSDLALWFTGGSGVSLALAGNQARARRPTKHFAGSTKPWPARRPRRPTFAEWFTRWDAGTTPRIIDRLALSAAGHGPRSRGPQSRWAPGDSPSLKTLQQSGLTLFRPSSRIGDHIPRAKQHGLIRRTDWLRAIGEALLWGSDRSDRFQTAARWCGEDHSQGRSPGGSAEPLRALPGWSTWRFTVANWPGEASRVELGHERRASSRAGRLRFWLSSVS